MGYHKDVHKSVFDNHFLQVFVREPGRRDSVKANISDVARLAGVSIGTVSRAFNDYPDISPATKEKIKAAARQLNYKPNVSARNLSAKKPPNIGLIMSGLLEVNPLDSNPHQQLQGIFGYALHQHLELALYATDSKEQRRSSFVEFCATHNLSGTILCGISLSDPYLQELMDAPIPTVSIDVPLSSPHTGWVSVDNVAAMQDLTRAMLALGHRKLLVIAGRPDAAINQDRMLGVQAALKEAGLPFPGDRVLYGDFSREQTRALLSRQLAQSGLDGVTCILCFSDLMAMGALEALKEAGVQVPGQVSVTGFDDQPIAQVLNPPLSTLRQDMRQIGWEAAALLHRMMTADAPGSHLVLPHDIILRGTTGPAPKPIDKGGD